MKEITLRFEGDIPRAIIATIDRDDCLEFSIKTGISAAEQAEKVNAQMRLLCAVGVCSMKARLMAGEMVAINYFVE